MRTLDDRVALTWAALLERVDRLAAGLWALGVTRGQTVALMLSNRPEFHICDHAAAMLGAVPFSIYLTYPPEQIRYLLADAGARVVIVEQAHLAAILAAREGLGGVDHVIVVDGEAPEGTLSLAAVQSRGDRSFDGARAAARVAAQDLLTLIYTSGTTGPPKGVELTHHNVMFAARQIEAIVELEPGSRVISWLPAAHIAERMAHHYIPTVYAGTITTCPDARQIVSYLPQVHPNWFFAVPRIWEKLKAGLEAMLAAQPPERRQPMERALAASLKRVRLRQRGQAVPAALEQEVAAYDRELFANVRAMLGLDQLRAVNAGAAPTPVDVLEFFHALGIEVAELWGMSETCGAGACNRPGEVRIGTVGPPEPGTEMRIAPDGELLVRAEYVMRGYRNAPEKTAEAIDADGWLHTGDIGEIDADGYLRIVDRKKELIINSAGKNMSPANIEACIKSASPLIGQACCIGDGRPYNTALIVLDADFAPQWAAQQGLSDTSLEALAREARVREHLEAAIEQANQRLARIEQIKKFAIVEGDWLPGGDELTPTMKLKRRPIAEKYRQQIERMYA